MVPRGRGPLSLSSRAPPVHFREVDLCCHEGAVPLAQRTALRPPSPPLGVIYFLTGVPDFDSAGANPGLPRSLCLWRVVCVCVCERARQGFLFSTGRRRDRPATSSRVG